jgi:hypothetical protein
MGMKMNRKPFSEEGDSLPGFIRRMCLVSLFLAAAIVLVTSIHEHLDCCSWFMFTTLVILGVTWIGRPALTARQRKRVEIDDCELRIIYSRRIRYTVKLKEIALVTNCFTYGRFRKRSSTRIAIKKHDGETIHLCRQWFISNEEKLRYIFNGLVGRLKKNGIDVAVEDRFCWLPETCDSEEKEMDSSGEECVEEVEEKSVKDIEVKAEEDIEVKTEEDIEIKAEKDIEIKAEKDIEIKAEKDIEVKTRENIEVKAEVNYEKTIEVKSERKLDEKEVLELEKQIDEEEMERVLKENNT